METLQFAAVVLGCLATIAGAIIKMDKGHKSWKATRNRG